MAAKNRKNCLLDGWLKSAIAEIDKASPKKLYKVTGKWNSNFLGLAFNLFVIGNKRGKHLSELAIKSLNSKCGSKKYVKELYKVLSQVGGVRWAKE